LRTVPAGWRAARQGHFYAMTALCPEEPVRFFQARSAMQRVQPLGGTNWRGVEGRLTESTGRTARSPSDSPSARADHGAALTVSVGKAPVNGPSVADGGQWLLPRLANSHIRPTPAIRFSWVPREGNGVELSYNAIAHRQHLGLGNPDRIL
jgi:hypothetical protein